MDGNSAWILFLVVGLATVVMWTSWFAALRASRGHPPFDRHIEQRRFAGYDAIPHMPDAAKRHVRRHFIALAIFVVVPLAIFLSAS